MTAVIPLSGDINIKKNVKVEFIEGNLLKLRKSRKILKVQYP
jgi:hypothetical protein